MASVVVTVLAMVVGAIAMEVEGFFGAKRDKLIKDNKKYRKIIL